MTSSATSTSTTMYGSTLARFISKQLRDAWRRNQLLTLAGVLHLLLIPAIFIGMSLDPKIINGANGWLKPLKFSISFAIYAFTFVWLLTYVQGHQGWVKQAANITGVALIIETSVITLQVVRGVASHFNVSSAFNIAIFAIMGIFIFSLSLMNLLVGILLVRQKLADPVFGWSLRLGLLISFVGMGIGFFMTAPTAEQWETTQAGQSVLISGTHSIGIDDGGPGLTFVGWNTAGGDLRVSHFLSLHAMQALPLAGWLLTRHRVRQFFTKNQRLVLIGTVGLAYFGWVVLLIWQALRGQSVLTPDGLTWAGYGLLVGGTLAVMLIVGVGAFIHQKR